MPGPQPKITDVKMAGFTHIPDEPVRLKADGHQMMQEIVALEVLVDVLRSYPNVEEMARNAHGRLYPEYALEDWENLFRRHMQDVEVAIGEREETIRQLREELRVAKEDNHAD